jgi:hypothetical protein
MLEVLCTAPIARFPEASHLKADKWGWKRGAVTKLDRILSKGVEGEIALKSVSKKAFLFVW